MKSEIEKIARERRVQVCPFLYCSHAEFLLSFSIDQSFKRLSKLVRVTGTLNNLNLAVNLKKKYGAAAIFVLYGNKNIPLVCKSIFVGDFTDINEVGENKNPFVNFDLKYEVSVGKSKSLRNSATVIVLSTGRIVHGTICLERNYIKTDEDLAPNLSFQACR
jgi:hypothetical protein